MRSTNKVQIKIKLFIVFAIGVVTIGYGQSSAYFEHITTDDGLSQSDINCIYQDKEGFIWLGTHDGLNKYDGYGFTVYTPDANKPSNISSNLIFDIVGDDHGNLWIGTTGKGLNYFNSDTGTFTVYRNEIGNNKSLSNDHISVLYKDSKNHLWIGTNDGLNMLDLSDENTEKTFAHFSSEQEPFITGWDGKSIYTIYEDSKGQLLVGGPGGLFKLSKDKHGNSYFRLVNDAIGFPAETVRAINEDRSGSLFIGTEQGLYCTGKNSDPRKVIKLTDGYFSDILIDNNDHIWAGTTSGLLFFENFSNNDLPRLVERYMYDPRNPHSLSKNIVKSLFLDRTGIIWIGTNGGGLNKFDPERKQFHHVRKTLEAKSLSYDKIRSMYEDSNGSLWIGTEGGGLNMLSAKDDDGEYNKFSLFESLPNAFALCEIREKDKKILLIGVENTPGLYRLDITNPQKVAKRPKPVNDVSHSVFALLRDSNNTVWIGTYDGGVHRWIPRPDGNGYDKSLFLNYRNDPNSLPSNIIRNIQEDKEGAVWFATGDGLSKLSKKERYKKQPHFEVYKNDPADANSLSHDYVLSLYTATDGTLWVGTFGGGLNKFVPGHGSKADTFISYSEENGLPNNVIKAILEDENGNLWLSTNKGLSRFSPEKKLFKNFDVDDGLQDSEFQELACLKRKNGEMLFGGINGFNSFFPQNIMENTIEPETVVTNFSIFNNDVGIGEEINNRTILSKAINRTEAIELKYKENSFSFEFAALHYAAPRKNKFAYILEGFDKEWIQTTSSKRFATYTNLAPGDYTLKVKASNNDGLWDRSPSKINIKVIPPFYLSNLALVFYALLGCFLLWLFYKYTFIRTTEKHQLELEHLEKETSEEMQRIKLEFFTNISHEFRTPLTLIKGPLEYLQKKGEKLQPEAVQEQYTLMHKNTNYLFKLVNQLLDFRKINQGKMRLVVRNSNIVDFVKEVAEPFQFLAHKKKIDFRITASDTALVSWFDHDALEKIMNNLLSNAFKFTPKRGSIEILIGAIDDLSGLSSLKLGEHTPKLVEIQVRDSGTGIEKSKLKSIFERFYVEKDGNKINREGVGIGLSFTKSLVELHQGNIEVKSATNRGTDFIVRLPQQKTAYLDIDEITCKEESESDFLVRSSETESFAIDLNDDILDKNMSSRKSSLPVLLVQDDNADIRTFIKQVLGDDYFIYEAENGEQGLEIVTKKMPDIIISDLIMPKMDGIEFCERVKNAKETSHIPIIMLTAKTSEESMLEGLKTGADDYLTKPFNMEMLKVKLSNIISQRDEMRREFNRNITLVPSDVTVTSLDEQFLKQAISIVEKHMMNTDFNVEMLVKEMGHSRSNLYLKFKEITGLSSSEFIRNIRLKRAVQLFEKSDYSVKEIMYMTGFNTASYFSKCFKKQFGVIPSEYVRQLKSNKEVSGL